MLPFGEGLWLADLEPEDADAMDDLEELSNAICEVFSTTTAPRRFARSITERANRTAHDVLRRMSPRCFKARR